MKRRPRIGSFLRIPLDNGKIAYARLIGQHLFSFYVLTEASSKAADLIQQLQAAVPIFSIYVSGTVFTNSNWEVIGYAPLEKALLDNMPVFFRQNKFKKEECWLISTVPGYKKSISPQDCINMERSGVWNIEHAASRLKDYFANRPNLYVERLKVEL